MNKLKNIFQNYNAEFKGYKTRCDFYEDEIAIHLYNDECTSASNIRIVDGDEENEINYHSSSFIAGQGLNQFLRKEVHKLLEGSGLLLSNCAINPISDHLLVKLGVPRTPEFDKYLRENKDLSYEEAVDYWCLVTHQKQF